MWLTSAEPSMDHVVWIPVELGAPNGARLGRFESVPIGEEYDEMK